MRRIRMLVMLVLVVGGGGAMVAADAQAAPARAGTVYGGFTAAEFPVVVRSSNDGRRMLRSAIGLEMKCTSGAEFSTSDGYRDLKVSRKGRFSDSFRVTDRNDDGTTTDYEGSLVGTFNKSRTKVSGTWAFKMTLHDAAGAVTDTCDSGTVRWSATQ